MRGGEGLQRGQLDDRLGLAFEQHRQHDDVARPRIAEAGADPNGLGRHIGEQDALLFGRALADEPLAERDAARLGGLGRPSA